MHRGRRDARLARREEGERLAVEIQQAGFLQRRRRTEQSSVLVNTLTYLTDDQRSQAGWIGNRMR